MIDVHLHILPGVDDGAASEEDSLRMAAALVEAGIHTVAATPHFNETTRALLPDRGAIARHVEGLRDLLARHEMGLEVVTGGECFLEPELPEMVKAGGVPTYNDAGYLLMELPAHHTIVHADSAVDQMHQQGVTIILAHAERYLFVQQSLSGLEPLLNCGIGVQVSLGSLGPRAGQAMRRTAESLLQQGLVHVLATDGHRAEGIRAALALRERAVALVGPDNLAVLTEENPRRILAGEPLLLCTPFMGAARTSGRRLWWPFGR